MLVAVRSGSENEGPLRAGKLTPVPFAIGEEFASKWQFLPFIEKGLTNYSRVDICNVGVSFKPTPPDCAEASSSGGGCRGSRSR